MKFKPIREKFLETNQRLMLIWQEGATFHKILGRKVDRQRPFVRGFSSISASGVQDFLELKDANGNRLFDVTDDYADTIMYHVGVGVNPKWLRMYTRYPSDMAIKPVLSFDAVSLGSSYSGFNNDRGFVTSIESPYNTPTDITEMIFPFKVDAAFGFVNMDVERIHFPVLNVEMAKYRFDTYDPKSSEDRFCIGKMARGQMAVYPFVIGNIEAPMSYPLSAHWGIEPVPLKDAKKFCSTSKNPADGCGGD